MAVTIRQQPSTPNGTQSDIIYVVSSDNTSQLQYKFVCDIQDNSGNVLSRIKQPINPSGYGVFEISNILDDYMGYDEIWNTTHPVNSDNSNIRDFRIAFGEEWGASGYGSVTLYNGKGATGNPAVSGSVITMIPAVEERSNGFNWESGSYYSNFLTNSPSVQWVKPSEYGTISHLNITNSKPTGFAVTVFNSAGQVIASKGFPNTYGTTNPSDKLIHIPSGPKNFELDGTLYILTGENWSYYTITATNGLGTKTFRRIDDCIDGNGKRFAFINRLGVWDWYSTTLTNTQNKTFKNNSYQSNFIDYSTNTGNVSWNPSKRGETIYNKIIDETYTAQTDWLTQEESDWLVELFESPSVFVQEGNNMLPIIVMNSSITTKTNPRSQKMFSYQIQYKLANKKKTRR